VDGPHEVEVGQVGDDTIAEPTDVVARLSTAAICGSDLHMYEGWAPGERSRMRTWAFSRGSGLRRARPETQRAR
jgi:threonine dehydrogenase-like Zn-dependent dehydrogenase